MGGISFWQLVIVGVVVAIPIASVIFVRKGNKTDTARPYRLLNLSFILNVALFPIFLISGQLGLDFLLVQLVCSLVGWAAFCVYLASLGVLASRLGRSPLVWVGLTFITSPFGFIISFFMMRRLVNASRK